MEYKDVTWKVAKILKSGSSQIRGGLCSVTLNTATGIRSPGDQLDGQGTVRLTKKYCRILVVCLKGCADDASAVGTTTYVVALSNDANTYDKLSIYEAYPHINQWRRWASNK